MYTSKPKEHKYPRNNWILKWQYVSVATNIALFLSQKTQMVGGKMPTSVHFMTTIICVLNSKYPKA